MIYQFIGLVFGLIFFIACLKAYTIGLQHGKDLNKGIVPKVEPVKSFKEYLDRKEEEKKVDLVSEGWNNINSYDPYKEKEGD